MAKVPTTPEFIIEDTGDEGVLVHWGEEIYVISMVTLERGFSPRLVLNLYQRDTHEVEGERSS